METERQLLDAIGNGDRQALRRLYDRYAGLAMATALRYVPDRNEVGDVVQDSFVSILTAISRFQYRGEGSLRSWVLRIVANRAIDHAKRQATMNFVDELPDETADEEPEVEQVPTDVLTAMIGRLPTGYRLVLNLYVFEQCSHREIARQLGIKESTSASQYARAKALLAKMIKEYLNHHRQL